LFPDFNQQEMLNYERQSIINEMNINKHELGANIIQLVEKHRYLDEVDSRSFADYLPNLLKFSLADLEKYHNEVFISKNMCIFISGHFFDKKVVQLIIDQVSKKSFSQMLNDFPVPQYSDFKIVIEEDKKIDGHYTILNFPGLNIENNQRERIALSMISKIMTSFKKGSGYSQIRKAGIYDFSINNWFGRKKGGVDIKSYLTQSQLAEWLTLISGLLTEVKAGKIDDLLFESIKKDFLINGKNEWRSNNRFDYITSFILDDINFIPWPELEKTIESITEYDLQDIAKRIFNLMKANLIIYGQKPTMKEDEIKNLLRF
jgi:predicted Zn-dependent peptidase